MKGSESLKQNRDADIRIERRPETRNENQCTPDLRQSALFASALARGSVPQTDGAELFEALSRLGNHQFLTALERAENRNKSVRQFADAESIPPQKAEELKAKLAQPAASQENTIERIHLQQDLLPLPRQLAGDSFKWSLLAPAAFDSGIFASYAAGISEIREQPAAAGEEGGGI